MIIQKLFFVLSSIALAVCSIMSLPAHADPGQDWDVFNIGSGEKIPNTGSKSPAVYTGTGKGWDVFRTGTGVSVDATPAYVGVSDHLHGAGWDVFRAGL